MSLINTTGMNNPPDSCSYSCRKVLSFLLLSCLAVLASAQSSNPFMDAKGNPLQLKTFSVSTELVQTFIDEYNVSVEYVIRPRFTLGFNYGKIHENSLFYPWFFSPDQLIWPGTVYKGDAFRPYVKYFPFKERDTYFCVKGVYKSMHYSSKDFTNGSDYGTTYNASESTMERGFDVLWGSEYKFGSDGPMGELYLGFGYRTRIRDYTIYTVDGSSIPSGAPSSYPLQIGQHHLEQHFPTLEIGCVLGMDFYK
jgi:hypothetical protein